MNSSDRTRALVEDLPTEIWTKIFHFVQHEFKVQLNKSSIPNDPYDQQWFLRPELTSSRIPAALAQVSSRWHSIVITIPEMWTTQVFTVDVAKPISSSDIQTSLDRSHNLPLDILVTRHPNLKEPTAREERAYLSLLIALLAPHFPRCRGISFYTIHNSALPKFGSDIAGNFPNLIELKLDCKINDGPFIDIDPDWHSVTSPTLQKFVANGQSFANMMSMSRDWPNRLPGLTSLSIIHLSRMTPIPLYYFLELLSDSMHLDYLRLSAVEVIYSSSEEFFIDLNLGQALVLEDLSRSVVHGLMFSIKLHSPELYVTRCSLNAMGSLPETPTLQLEEIAISDNLAHHLKNWRGQTLTLIRCQGFNSELLDMLSTVSSFSGAPHLTKLTVVDCTNFTGEVLRKMVEARKKTKKGVIENLIVRGKGPALSGEDASWLKDELKVLEWNTRTEDGVESVYM